MRRENQQSIADVRGTHKLACRHQDSVVSQCSIGGRDGELDRFQIVGWAVFWVGETEIRRLQGVKSIVCEGNRCGCSCWCVVRRSIIDEHPLGIRIEIHSTARCPAIILNLEQAQEQRAEIIEVWLRCKDELSTADVRDAHKLACRHGD